MKVKKMNDLQIVEVKQYLDDSNLQNNFYQVMKLLRKLDNQLHFTLSVNLDDYNYMNTIISKIKVNLEKIDCILNLQQQ